MGVEPSTELRDSSDITLTPSQPIHSDFFSGTGVFWSTEMSVFIGTRMVNEVSSQDARAIFMAQMAGINTMQIISGQTKGSRIDDTPSVVRWQTAMAEIQSQLSDCSIN